MRTEPRRTDRARKTSRERIHRWTVVPPGTAAIRAAVPGSFLRDFLMVSDWIGRTVRIVERNPVAMDWPKEQKTGNVRGGHRCAREGLRTAPLPERQDADPWRGEVDRRVPPVGEPGEDV